MSLPHSWLYELACGRVLDPNGSENYGVVLGVEPDPDGAGWE